ncbi:hypothetical protein WN943_013357 [Citrus x changshan-huyou]
MALAWQNPTSRNIYKRMQQQKRIGSKVNVGAVCGNDSGGVCGCWTNSLSNAAMSKGVNHCILVVHANSISSLNLLPFSFFITRTSSVTTLCCSL